MRIQDSLDHSVRIANTQNRTHNKPRFVQFHQQELEAIYRYSCSPRTVADEERLDLDLFHAGIEVDS